ncbi:hypothetical protein [Chondromyces apiculatus]|nr:hypothetical protein [Chondromyces apiculatus]
MSALVALDLVVLVVLVVLVLVALLPECGVQALLDRGIPGAPY